MTCDTMNASRRTPAVFRRLSASIRSIMGPRNEDETGGRLMPRRSCAKAPAAINSTQMHTNIRRMQVGLLPNVEGYRTARPPGWDVGMLELLLEFGRYHTRDQSHVPLPAACRQPFMDYKDLTVWQHAMDLCQQIYRVTDQFPEREVFGLTSQ